MTDTVGVAVVGVAVVVAEGNADNGSGIHPTIGESTAPTLNATAIPATNRVGDNTMTE